MRDVSLVFILFCSFLKWSKTFDALEYFIESPLLLCYFKMLLRESVKDVAKIAGIA